MDPSIVLVLLVSTRGSDPAWPAMRAAAQKALGKGSVVLVLERAEAPTDDESLALRDRVRANAVVEIRWTEEDGSGARLHLHRAQGVWIDRDLAFDASDPPAERGRTIGFALGSMIAESESESAEDEMAAPPPFGPFALPLERRPRLPTPAQRWRGAVEASFQAALGGDASGLGASAGVRWFLTPRVALRASGAIRTGWVSPARASSVLYHGAAGATVELTAFGPVEVGVRADLLVMRQMLVRSGARAGRWISGADAAIEAAWFFTPSFAIAASTGAEAAFGDTDVLVGSERVAGLPAVRATGELGLRFRF